jgi:DNA-3-methyladenine glycosylase
MFSEGGVAYVYFTYGNHYCVNVVVEKENVAHAVLIRALEPLEGLEFMKENRGTDDIYNLTNGPGKLSKALEIDLKLNGAEFTGEELFICRPHRQRRIKIARSKRIGIAKNPDKLYRFYAADNPFVSGVNANSILRKK